MKQKNILLGLLRLVLGWVMLWGFLDKLFGLGFATASDKSWLSGVSPTAGFLKFGTNGPFASMFQSMAGSQIVDWLFMVGLLLIGIALIIGIGVRIAGYSGALLMFLMWTAVFPSGHNPAVDEHIVYLLLFLLLGSGHAGYFLGFGRWWAETSLVRNHNFLE